MSGPELAEAILARIEAELEAQRGPTKRKGKELDFRCFNPERHWHGDAHPSARWNRDKLAWFCDICRDGGGWKDLAYRLGLDGYQAQGHTPGVTLAALAKARGLDPAFLFRSLGWRDAPDPWHGHPAIAIPYRDAQGHEVRIRWRLRLEKPKSGKDNRFAWGPGDTIIPYGLWRLQQAREAGYIVVGEGETDGATCWTHDIPYLGLPGKGTWRCEWAQYLVGIETVYLWQEPGAEDLAQRVARDVPNLRVVKAPPEAKDPTELAKLLGSSFHARFQELLAQAQSAQPPNLTSDGPLYKGGAEVRALPRVNAAALQQEALRPGRPGLRFLPLLGRERFLVVGFSHLLSGYPKTGKTELLARLAWDWATTGHSVLYMTEEPLLVWEERLAHLPQGGKSVNLVFALGSPLEVLHTIGADQEQVVIVDTLRLLGLSDENDNSEINRVLTPLIALCRKGEKTLILAHHTRKGGGEFGTAAAGGHVLVGVVDMVLELHRDGQATNRRTLKGWGRIVQVPELVYELQDGELVALGDPQEVAVGEVKVRLQKVLSEEWRKTKELREALGDPRPSEDQMTKALGQMAASGEIERNPPVSEGKQAGKTYQWRVNLTSDYNGKVIGGEVLAAIRGTPDDEEGEV